MLSPLLVLIIEVNSATSVIKNLSFNSSKKSTFKGLFFVDNSKSPPRKVLELFVISFSILFFKIVTEEKISKLMKIVKKTFLKSLIYFYLILLLKILKNLKDTYLIFYLTVE